MVQARHGIRPIGLIGLPAKTLCNHERFSHQDVRHDVFSLPLYLRLGVSHKFLSATLTIPCVGTQPATQVTIRLFPMTLFVRHKGDAQRDHVEQARRAGEANHGRDCTGRGEPYALAPPARRQVRLSTQEVAKHRGRSFVWRLASYTFFTRRDFKANISSHSGIYAVNIESGGFDNSHRSATISGSFLDCASTVPPQAVVLPVAACCSRLGLPLPCSISLLFCASFVVRLCVSP